MIKSFLHKVLRTFSLKEARKESNRSTPKIADVLDLLDAAKSLMTLIFLL